MPDSFFHAGRPGLSPAGLQSLADLRGRRLIAISLNCLLYIGFIVALVGILQTAGWSAASLGVLFCFLILAPWPVVTAVNAGIGFVLACMGDRGLRLAAPFWPPDQAATLPPTAIVMTLRNENTGRAVARLRAVMQGIEETGHASAFRFFILSDSSDPAIIAAERAACAADRRITYRHRAINTGFKAGNLRAFCETDGLHFTFMLPLDADSQMDGDTILAMLRVGAAYPKLGILQSLVVGAPTQSGFARLFQFGMRHGMRCHTLGMAWWAADCGPFWGHNALVRLAPFRDHCKLPVLAGNPPLGGPILSHDQVEAVLMRRAGFEVRVLPVETGSFEDTPPDALEFCRRDMRWCQGNLQYFGLLRTPGLLPMSRFQLCWAILMFAGLPASQLVLLLIAVLASDAGFRAHFPAGPALIFYLLWLLLGILPKLAGIGDVVRRDGGMAAYGGGAVFLCSACTEMVFAAFLVPLAGFRTALFMAGIPLRRKIGWGAQNRDARAIRFATACGTAWPACLFGIAIALVLLIHAPAVALLSIPYLAGLVLAPVFVWLTARPGFGAFLLRHRIGQTPEEVLR